jgi:hypothetical protein
MKYIISESQYKRIIGDTKNINEITVSDLLTLGNIGISASVLASFFDRYHQKKNILPKLIEIFNNFDKIDCNDLDKLYNKYYCDSFIKWFMKNPDGTPITKKQLQDLIIKYSVRTGTPVDFN